jgi:phosphatidylserine/phosphatidylglycerophosphate/cardiolipin synthase-like enzyme
VLNGIEVQVIKTIAPHTYPMLDAGDRGIRELYLNALQSAGAGSLVYIENQYFFDHGVISEIYEAAETRDARIIALLTSKPDEGLITGRVESIIEKLITNYGDIIQAVAHHQNVALLTLGNCRPDPRAPGKFIYRETYIHSKNMAVINPDGAVMTGGSANIAFTSMRFHSEMNIAFMDPNLIKGWVARLWCEHLQISLDRARALIDKPDYALAYFKAQAGRNLAALSLRQEPEGRVFDREGWNAANIPPPDFSGIALPVPLANVGSDCQG